MLQTVLGYQHFNNAPITARADDGSYAGVLGEFLSMMPAGQPAEPGHGVYGVFVPKIELDIAKRFNDRARLRVDMSFGRAASGSYVAGVLPNHVYAAVRLTRNYNVELVVGRFGLQPGYEPFKPYLNDTISWSVIWRGALCPAVATGMQLSADLTNTFSIYFTLANGAIEDLIYKNNNWPAVVTSFEWEWGNEAWPSTLVLSPYVGADSGENRPITYGADATLTYWASNKWKIGLEALFQMDNAEEGFSNTAYASGLVNIFYRFTPEWYGVLKGVFARQTSPTNGSMNLTGDKQSTYESSLGVGYQLSDVSKIKGEFRLDVIDPASSRKQYIPGVAFSYEWML